jgi:putative FmdB family regulatory protein
MLYEYECVEHGVFESDRAIRDFASPGVCPACGREAPRILSAPRLSCIARSDRIARDRNDQSCHEPRLVVSDTASAGSSRTRAAVSHGRPWVLG